MKKFLLLFAIIAGLLIFLPDCKKDLPNPDEGDTTAIISEATKYVNNWIWDVMNEVYLWNSSISQTLDPDLESDPENFFKKMLYSKDRFSWITDDYQGLMDQYYGVATSTGYSPAFGRFSNTDGVFILVEYVYPGSPADVAGLKRGDIILQINNADLNIANYLRLFNSTSQTVTLGELIGGSISPTDRKITIVAQEIALDPTIYYEIKEIAGHKIGYLVYVEFTSGKDREYLYSLEHVLDTFTVAGVTDLIIDFRYNPGGDSEAATFFASAIAPASVVQNHEVLVRFEYNSFYNNYFLQQEGADSPRLVCKFSDTANYLNLSKVYFLTTGGTASACEFTISGLFPYMDVVLVGESTYGKYCGAWIIPDLAEPPQHNWGLVPVVMKYANKDGYTDFDEGIPADITIEDDLFNAVPFGDLRDSVLYKAVEAIVGPGQIPGKKASLVKKHMPYELLYNPMKDRRRNLFLPPPVLK
jgi:carboxyl-terminal processing protease